MEIKNNNILITGASKGIGAATAIKLAQLGANVIINYNGDTTSAEHTLTKCNEFSNKHITIKADITNENEVVSMMEEIKKHYGHLDVLINNAAIFSPADNPTNLDTFTHIWNINFLAQVRIIKHALELMDSGKIINVSSIHGRIGHGNPTAIAYSALKAALDSYTKNLAKDLAPNILVNAVAPGRTLTPMWGEMTEDEIKDLGDGQLIERFIKPEEIAHAIAFLLENDAMCGEILTIDGGMSLKTLG